MADTEKDTIVVFTARSPERIIAEGGSKAWVLNPVRAKQCRWLVCTQNRHHPDHQFSDATEPHGAAFLVGKISAIERAPDEGDGNRWIIQIGEVARINTLDVWGVRRNPVHYTSLAELGIAHKDLLFEPLPENSESLSAPVRSSDAKWPPANLTIAEAKKALAASFGVTAEAVEIIIRG